MRGTLKTAALEHYFPLLAVEHDCILSKNAEVTVAYRVVLPELFTLTAAEYEALHGAWLKALRVLPDYTIVHKQDYFTEEHYRPDLASDESFLGRAFERHFNERPFLRHSCYLFITKTSKEQMRRRSDFSSDDQDRLARAQRLLRLASDGGATPQERQHAYTKARAELDGLITLPAPGMAALERRMAGEIEA